MYENFSVLVPVPEQNVRCMLTFDPGQHWGENLGVRGAAPPVGGLKGGKAPFNKKGSHFSTKNQLFHPLARCTLTSGPHCTFDQTDEKTCPMLYSINGLRNISITGVMKKMTEKMVIADQPFLSTSANVTEHCIQLI